MSDNQNNQTLGQRVATKGTEIAISEAKSAAAWYAIGNMGKIFALVATLAGGATILAPRNQNTLYGGLTPNTGHKAGAGEWSCLTTSGLITAYKPKYLKDCTTSPKFMLFE